MKQDFRPIPEFPDFKLNSEGILLGKRGKPLCAIPMKIYGKYAIFYSVYNDTLKTNRNVMDLLRDTFPENYEVSQ